MKTYTNLKISLTLILFMICSISGYMVGQTSSDDEKSTNKQTTTFKYVSPNNTWTTVGYAWLDNRYGSHRFRFSPDSVFFEGQWYFQLQGSGSESGENWGNIGLFREEDGIVYGIIQDEEHVFMDFNLEIGDRITIPLMDYEDSYEYIVLEIDTIELLDGSRRKRLLLDCYEWDGFGVYFVEGLGSMGVYIGQIGCFLDESESLLCFHHNEDLIYSNQFFEGCWITSVTDIHAHGINVYPNPFSDVLNISSKGYEKLRLIAYDLYGRIIYTSNEFDTNYQVNTQNWTPGVYFIVMKEGKKQIFSERIVLFK